MASAPTPEAPGDSGPDPFAVPAPTAQDIAWRLGACFARKDGSGYLTYCPLHNSAMPGLLISDDKNGAIGYSCDRGCDSGDIKAHLLTMGNTGTSPGAPGPAYANGAGSHDADADADGYSSDEPPKIEALVASSWLVGPETNPDPILCDLFDRGDKVVIIGQSKTRKSFFTLQLALCLASGQSFIGFVPVERRRVLLIQSEIKKDRYHARCKRMVERLGLDLEALDGLLIANTRGLPSQQLAIEALADEYKPDVVVIDPFYKVISGDESKSEDVKPVLRFFDSLAERLGAAVVYVHHDKKGVSGDQQLTDRGSGTGILARDFDSAIFLSPHRDIDSDLVVEFIARNYPPVPAMCVEWANYCFVTSSSLPVKQTSRSMAKDKTKITFDGALAACQAFVGKQLAKGVTEMVMAIFNEHLKNLGLNKDTLSACKASLEDSEMIKIRWRTGTKDSKDTKGLPKKFVEFLKGPSGNSNGSAKSDIEDFDDEFF